MRGSACATAVACLAALSVGLGCSGGSSGSADGTAGMAGAEQTPTGGTSSGGAPSAGTGGKTATGGTSNTGGATSTGGAGGVTHTIGNCDSLPAAGTWETITPTEVTPAADALSVFVAVNPQNPAIVYTSAGTWATNRGFYRSSDCGSTWKKLDSGRNSAAINSGFQWVMMVDPTDGDVVYAANGYGSPPSLFKSTNGGEDWDNLFPDGSEVSKTVQYNFTQGLDMDPTDPKHIVVTFHADCTGDYAPMCMAETTDAGATWRLFKGPTSGWQEGAAPVVIGGAKFLYSAPSNGVYYTEDRGAHWEKVADSGSGQLYTSKGGTHYLGSGNGVLQSNDGHTWTKIPNSPLTSGIIGNGETIFTTSTSIWNGKPFYSAPEANPSTWTNLQSPTYTQGGSYLAYDRDHHVLYSCNYQGGLTRVVVQ